MEPPNQGRTSTLLNIEALAIGIGLFVTLTGSVIGVEMRYAKTTEVQSMVDEVYLRTVRLRVFELELKDRDHMKPHEKALLEHLKRELTK
jgi:hypothetical protein